MPSSHLYQIPTIIKIICGLKPDSILDIGCGFGKYGFLAREYLEIWQSRYQKSEWVTKIDCIEVYGTYLTELHQYIYDQIYRVDALSVMKDLGEKAYSLILAIDVLEHFSVDQGKLFIKECQRIGTYSLISTPKEFGEQEAVFGNSYEVHRSVWSQEDLTALGAQGFATDPFSIIGIF
jgi:2-polyprenyl-3-methyl-5-hydroxy-6-metoxy-1,4-benzoquinol methylase